MCNLRVFFHDLRPFLARYSRTRFIFLRTSGRRQRIQRVTLDGLGQTTIVKSGLSDVKSLVLDYVDKRIFWLDNSTGTIESSYYDGSERETVRAGLK